MSEDCSYDQLPSVSWFPGHMLKAEREIRKKLKLVDVVIEIVDARAPATTRNYRLEEIVANKYNLIVLSKGDLSNQQITMQWQEYYRQSNIHYTTFEKGTKAALKRLKEKLKKVTELCQSRLCLIGNSAYRPVRAMVVGMPNVGKSTVINSLAGKNIAKTGPAPGVTRLQQWVRISKSLELLDTPGIMIPRVETREAGLMLGAVAVVRDKVLHLDHVCRYIFDRLKHEDHPASLDIYDLRTFPDSFPQFLDAVARRRGYVRPGGEPDSEKTVEAVVHDFRRGLLGRFSLERPNH